MPVSINKLWEKKIEQFSDKIRAIARGDDDLYQEGLLGLRQGLLRNPYGTDAFFISAIKWAMSHYKSKGVSIDNGPRWEYTKRLADGTIKTYRKDVRPIYIDDFISEFTLELSESAYAPDVLALDRICAEKFYNLLNGEEAKFVKVCIQTLNGYFYDAKARRMLGIGRVRYYRIRKAAYEKFIRAFGTDEEVEMFDQLLDKIRR
jgi:hypothetical protein